MRRSLSRRRFLAAAASVGAGALVLPRASARSYQANEKVGVALVGVSGRGSWFVSLLERDSVMRGVALCDVDTRRAAEAYGKFPDLPKYEDFRVMLDKQKDIDGVIVATPEFSRPLVLAAA
ncbi:MAG TPA: Gfo/Idh/MocA family oxidoreductase, partial [Thermoguttaceae bacterium]|nr:Gfo/Idh/MocA family oxidoreductase [Thermoguttaceae bacterium]